MTRPTRNILLTVVPVVVFFWSIVGLNSADVVRRATATAPTTAPQPPRPGGGMNLIGMLVVAEEQSARERQFTYTVTRADDYGRKATPIPRTLRYALQELKGARTIRFAPGLGTIRLKPNYATITGAGQRDIRVYGGNDGQTIEGGICIADGAGPVLLDNLRLRPPAGTANMDCLLLYGYPERVHDITVRNCALQFGTDECFGCGGAVRVYVTHCLIGQGIHAGETGKATSKAMRIGDDSADVVIDGNLIGGCLDRQPRIVTFGGVVDFRGNLVSIGHRSGVEVARFRDETGGIRPGPRANIRDNLFLYGRDFRRSTATNYPYPKLPVWVETIDHEPGSLFVSGNMVAGNALGAFESPAAIVQFRDRATPAELFAARPHGTNGFEDHWPVTNAIDRAADALQHAGTTRRDALEREMVDGILAGRDVMVRK